MIVAPPSLDKSTWPTVLVVDDDSVSRNLFTACLKLQHLQIIQACDGREAMEIIQDEGADFFDCLLTDYRMPQVSGLELIEWLKGVDGTLASIIITAEGEKGLVAECLRTGAVDFLEKPVTVETLTQSVLRAVVSTKNRRQFRAQMLEVQGVSDIKDRLQKLRMIPGLPAPEFFSHAMSEVGGDFVELFPVGEQRFLLLCGDVSGHDLKAGFVSAYFQGLVRGLIEKETPIEEIAQLFNRLLIREWGQERELGSLLSLSACFLYVDFRAGEMEFINCGFPLPYLCNGEGEVSYLSKHAQPLGWFETLETKLLRTALQPEQTFYLYTDGLEGLAETLGVHPCSLAYRLLSEKQAEQNQLLLQQAQDDVLVLRLKFFAESAGQKHYWPLLSLRYSGAEWTQIDAIQALWERSLTLALGREVMGNRFYDVVVACREAVLNGLKHGCKKKDSRFCHFSLCYESVSHSLRATINDDGVGHNFDIEQRERDCESLRENNLGLTMIKGLADKVIMQSEGASLIMDFYLNSPKNI